MSEETYSCCYQGRSRTYWMFPEPSACSGVTPGLLNPPLNPSQGNSDANSFFPQPLALLLGAPLLAEQPSIGKGLQQPCPATYSFRRNPQCLHWCWSLQVEKTNQLEKGRDGRDGKGVRGGWALFSLTLNTSTSSKVNSSRTPCS